MAELPTLAALHLPDEDDYGLALYDTRRGVWVLVEGRAIGDIGPDRVGELIPAHWSPRECRCNQPDSARDRSHDRGDEAFCRDSFERAE